MRSSHIPATENGFSGNLNICGKDLQSSQVQGKSTLADCLAFFMVAKAEEKSSGCLLFVLLLISAKGVPLAGFSSGECSFVL